MKEFKGHLGNKMGTEKGEKKLASWLLKTYDARYDTTIRYILYKNQYVSESISYLKYLTIHI